MYGIGLTLGAGIYVLIGKAAGLAGNSMWISFALASIVAGVIFYWIFNKRISYHVN